jgi:hypothetical protein
MKSETATTLSFSSQTSRRETRRNWANCFPRRKTKPNQADFIGVVALETGQKFWVGIWEKRDRNGERFMSIGLAAKQE